MSFPSSVNITSINGTAYNQDVICETLQCSVKLYAPTVETDNIECANVVIDNITPLNDVLNVNGNVLVNGNVTCDILNYNSLNPPVSGGSPVWFNAFNTADQGYTGAPAYDNVIFDVLDWSGTDFSYNLGEISYNGAGGKFQINFNCNMSTGGYLLVKVDITNPQVVAEYYAMTFTNNIGGIIPGSFSLITDLQTGQKIAFKLTGSGIGGLNRVALGFYNGASCHVNIHKI